MKLQNPEPLLKDAVRKALRPYAPKLREFFDELPGHHERINRWSAAQAEEDWYDLHDKASHGDKAAQKTLESLPLADYRSWLKRYGTMESVHHATYENWHKTFVPTFRDAARDVLEAAKRVGEFAQRQLDELHEAVNEPKTPSAWANGDCNHVVVLCRYILDDRAEADPTFFREYV